jgi:nicotinate-nucleotide adenylyltransferase
MNIVLYGGNFDPVHSGHIHVAETILKSCPVDSVWFLPAGHHPHKDTCMFTWETRILFLTESTKHNPKLRVSDLDKRDEGPSYTVFLIDNIKKMYPDYHFSFLIGSDNVVKLKTWYEFKKLLDMIDIMVIDRTTDDRDLWKDLDYIDRLTFIKMPLYDLSSSEIREKIVKLVVSNLISDIHPPI